MELEDDDVVKKGKGQLTYMSWCHHIEEFFLGYWKNFIIYIIAGFGAYYAFLEIVSKFFPDINIDEQLILISVLALSIFGAFYKSVRDYRHAIPTGLQKESLLAQSIARSKRRYWEFALANELIKNRIDEIDKNLDDVINNRVHIKVVSTLDEDEYIDWIKRRPTNLLSILDVAKQLLIIDLNDAIFSIYSENTNDSNFSNIIKTADLIESVYKETYEFEINGKQIAIPESFEVLHEIPSDWIGVIRDGFHQMLQILKQTSERNKGDVSTIEGTINFGDLPRLDEFCEECDRLQSLMNY